MNIVDEWSKLGISNDKNNKNNWILIKYKLLILNIFKLLKKKLYKLLNHQTKTEVNVKFENYNVIEIENKIKKLKNTINLKNEFKVIKISQNSFLIKKI